MKVMSAELTHTPWSPTQVYRHDAQDDTTSTTIGEVCTLSLVCSDARSFSPQTESQWLLWELGSYRERQLPLRDRQSLKVCARLPSRPDSDILSYLSPGDTLHIGSSEVTLTAISTIGSGDIFFDASGLTLPASFSATAELFRYPDDAVWTPCDPPSEESEK